MNHFAVPGEFGVETANAPTNDYVTVLENLDEMTHLCEQSVAATSLTSQTCTEPSLGATLRKLEMNSLCLRITIVVVSTSRINPRASCPI